MPTPNSIDHDAQRCRHFEHRIQNPECIPGFTKAQMVANYAEDLLPHLAAVLAELERLREAEEPPVLPEGWRGFE